MRTRFGNTLAIALLFGSAAAAQAQTAYPYRYKDEPLMSINRSYLGYSNFVDYGPGLPAHVNPPPRGGYATGYAAPRTPAYAPAPARAPVYSVPARRGRLFGWLRGYR